MISQGIDQRTRIVSEARMNNQAGRLIYNNQRLVFINNIKRNVFRLYQILIARTIEQKRYDIVGFNAIITLFRPPIDVDEAGLSRLLYSVARRIGQMSHQKLIYTKQLLALVGYDAKMFIQSAAVFLIYVVGYNVFFD